MPESDDFVSENGLNSQLHQQSRAGLEVRFARGQRRVREFPQVCPAPRPWPLRQEHLSATAHYHAGFLHRNRGKLLLGKRDLVLRRLPEGLAALREWADGAPGIGRQTHQSAKFHQRLVELAWLLDWE